MKLIFKFCKNTDAATAIEYGLIAAGVALMIVASIFAFGFEMREIFEFVSGELENAVDNAENSSNIES